jgi:predicted permease
VPAGRLDKDRRAADRTPDLTAVFSIALPRPTAWARTAALVGAWPMGAGAFILAEPYGRAAGANCGTVLVSTAARFATLSPLLVWLTAAPSR